MATKHYSKYITEIYSVSYNAYIIMHVYTVTYKKHCRHIRIYDVIDTCMI